MIKYIFQTKSLIEKNWTDYIIKDSFDELIGSATNTVLPKNQYRYIIRETDYDLEFEIKNYPPGFTFVKLFEDDIEGFRKEPVESYINYLESKLELIKNIVTDIRTKRSFHAYKLLEIENLCNSMKI